MGQNVMTEVFLKHENSHTSFVFYSDGIVRICHKEGVELTSADVKENFKIIEQRSHPHPVVLIDHRNSYSLAFSAQEILRKSDFSLAVAVLVNGITRIRLAQTVVDVMRIKARCEIFTDEAKAFRWLKKVSNIENDQFTQ